MVEPVPNLLVALCDRSARGGGLRNQPEEVERASETHTPVVVRSTEFPTSAQAQANQVMARLVAGRRGRRLVIPNTELRHVVALSKFRERYGLEPHFDAFLREAQPLGSLPSLREIFPGPSRTENDGATARASDELLGKDPRTPGAPHDGERSPATNSKDNGVIHPGETQSRTPKPVTLDPSVLTRHVTVMGGTGSGKNHGGLAHHRGALGAGHSSTPRRSQR
jgi:hypothetical protein